MLYIIKKRKIAKKTVEELINGNTNVVQAYKNVKKKWNEILENFNWDSHFAVNEMIKLVNEYQLEMEDVAGENYLGQEIMATVGIKK